MRIIKIQTNDGEIFSVDSEIFKCSGTIWGMLQWADGVDGGGGGGGDGGDGSGVSGEEKEELVHLEKLDGPTWKKICEWATYHKDDPPPKNDDQGEQQQQQPRQTEMGTWDADFVKKLDPATLFKLLNATNFLDIKPLLDILAKAVANLAKGKSPEENRQMFGIRNPLARDEM